MIHIDGSHGEGGGQIVRTALAFSTALNKPFEVDNIRKGRGQAGLKAQHLTCLKALEQMCGAKFNDVGIGSTKLRYIPGKIKARKVDVDIGTAGSITLLLQSLLVPSFFAPNPITISITGGTSGKWQMPFDYFNRVFVPHLRKYAEINAVLRKRGYFPKGGGNVEITIKPKFKLASRSRAPKINLVERGDLVHIGGISHASAMLQDANVAERQADAAKASLAQLGADISISTEYCNTKSPGSGIALWAIFSRKGEPGELNPIILGGDTIGEKGFPAEKVGEGAAKMLAREIESGAAVDEHLADNLIPFLALFGGRMKVSTISNHTKSNIYVAEQFLGKRFEIDEKEKIISTVYSESGQ